MLRKDKKSDFEKRVIIFGFSVLLIFTLLIGRLSFIQFIKGEEYKTSALNQRIKDVRVYIPRGNIYDKNLIPLTNRKRIPTLIAFKGVVEGNSEYIASIKNVTNYSTKELINVIDSSSSIMEIPIASNKINEAKSIKGAIVVDKIPRYGDENILSHVIGYIKTSTNEGQSGIEKAYDSILKFSNQSGVIQFTIDGRNRVVPGAGYREVVKDRAIKTNSIKLTIDYHLQKEIERIMDDESKEGAAIVAEVESGDILAMVSRPNFDQNNIAKYLQSNKMEFYNRAIEVSYPPGSIFKIVVLIAAIEENQVSFDEKFYCSGEEHIGTERTIRCHAYSSGGHGEINIREAFYDSCNSVFIQLGQRIGGQKIIDTAAKLGFGEKVQTEVMEESPGNLPMGNELLGPAIGNISIGQGSIEVTPLQVTKMMVTIANNGLSKDISIVDSIVAEDGTDIRDVIRDKDKRVLSKETCIILKDFMQDVISKGTGDNISIAELGGGGGKTGSAQAILNSKETVHGWFSGFFPKENPKYVITVLAEGGQSGAKSAGPVFEKIAKAISKLKL